MKPEPVGGLARIPLEDIHPNPRNPRQHLEDIEDLAASIKARGLIQPLVVHPRKKGGGYELLSGHRRYAALCHLDADTALCLVAQLRADVDAIEVMLVENGQRVGLTPMEEARAYERLVRLGLSQAQIARGVGRSQTHVSMRLALTHLPPDQQAQVDSGEMRVVDAVQASRLRRGIADNTKFTGWHLGKTHPLAEQVRETCKAAGHPQDRRVGGIGCGRCWEDAIRADERALNSSVVDAQHGMPPATGGHSRRGVGMTTASVDVDWRTAAECRHHAPEVFFPDEKSHDPCIWDQPRAICAGCPVREQCLSTALATGEQHGMFGGLTPDERAQLGRRRTTHFQHGTEAGYRRHRRLGEAACGPCLEGARQAYADRSQQRRTA